MGGECESQWAKFRKIDFFLLKNVQINYTNLEKVDLVNKIKVMKILVDFCKL